MKVVFFGASVSEQTVKYDDQTITGYVNYLDKSIQALGLTYDVHRITAGSCAIHDAGLALVDDVVNLNPDICILEWSTAGDSSCSYDHISSIYNKLTSNNILPINLILPRRDRDQTQTNVYKYSKEISNMYSLPFWDFSGQVKKEQLETILRDSVHTNNMGAKLYSDFIVNKLINLELQSVPLVESKLKLNRKIYKFDNKINKINKINIELSTETSFKKNNIYIFLEQRIGPWSRVLNCSLSVNQIRTEKIENVMLHDPWSWRERQCIKPLAPFTFIEEKTNSVTFEIETHKDETSCLKYGKDKVDYEKFRSEIRPKGRLIVLCDNQQYEMKTSRDTMENKKQKFIIPDNLQKKMLSHDQTVEYMADSLNSDSPFMVSRFGSIEGEVIQRTLFKGPLDVDEALRSKARGNAGIAKPNNQTLKRFSLEYMASIAQADLLAIWNFPEQVNLAQKTANNKICALNYIDPVFNYSHINKSWTSVLKNKKVLVIHPFESSIRHQYENKENVNLISKILPDFNLLTLAPPQTVERHNDVPYSWDQELEMFKKKILDYDFDVAIVGAGGYGAPIASFIKQLGKQSIHLGGVTQLLFGIIGKRWESRPYMQGIIGNGWVRPKADEKHKNASKIEGGCYW